MDKLLEQAKNTYILALETHIKLLTKCFTSHKATEETYEWLFDIFHELSEKQESVSPSNDDEDSLVSFLYKQVWALKDSLNKSISGEKDEWVKNQLIQKYDDIQLLRAKLWSLVYDEVEDTSEVKKPLIPKL